MTWGVQTWDENGNPNNYGIKPVSVNSTQLLTNGQKSGTWVVEVPAGLRLNFYHVPNDSDSNSGGMGIGRRRIVVTGNAVVVSAAGDYEYSADTFPAARAFLIFTIERSA